MDTRKSWTQREQELLIRRKEEGKKWPEIASELNKTPYAVRQKYRRLTGQL